MTAQNDKRTDKRISSLFSSVDRWTDEPDRQFLGTLRERSTAEFLTSSVGPNRKSQMATVPIWRIIMNNKITRLAAAAVIAVGVAGLLLSLFHNGASTAWAIEETIKTLENIKAIKLVGKMTQWAGGVADVTIWAADANGEQSEYFRMDTSEQILVATPETTYRYWPGISKVRIEKANGPKVGLWLGKAFFENLKENTVNWNQSFFTDDSSGITYAVVDCNRRDGGSSWRFVFDIETGLPVSFRETSHMKESDIREMEFSQIEYDPQLPNGIFDFEIPEGTVIEGME